jgi:NAD(P)-dependent dehydrogenase (short-subunit alcohol dehydrogenase family)
LIVGGTSELGSRVLDVLHAEGARAAFTYFRNAERAELLTERTGAPRRQVDVTRTEELGAAIDALAQGLGGLDALIHCAAVTSSTDPPAFDTLTQVTEQGFDRLFAVNVRSAFFCAVGAARHLHSGGNIVFLGSIDGVKSVPSPAAYASSKGAISGLARSLAKELGPRGVRVNVVSPGILDGGASRVIPESVRAEYLKHTCAKRYGKLEEAAQLVAWLALSNTYVTGQSIALDGGL